LALKRLFAVAETLPGNSAECERGFSMMNEAVWDKRSRLQVESISSTMFLKLNRVPLEKFDPYQFVRSWLATGNRLSTSCDGCQVQQPPKLSMFTRKCFSKFYPDNKWHVWCGLSPLSVDCTLSFLNFDTMALTVTFLVVNEVYYCCHKRLIKWFCRIDYKQHETVRSRTWPPH